MCCSKEALCVPCDIIVTMSRMLAPMFSGRRKKFERAPPLPAPPAIRPLAISESLTVCSAVKVLFALCCSVSELNVAYSIQVGITVTLCCYPMQLYGYWVGNSFSLTPFHMQEDFLSLFTAVRKRR